ncbi:uncharacterized protein [Blastocystis hominis]|uniref:AAA+ ATPase domain-containing protein n=1 Tax=Blastocystis hominis TaxID=12968 RepID=D8M954_BLAHO|nr:uncharacterized protein [Blastocystis hominis]CBK24593.2 unnamed protein product [Blastocystis hominis]|eukprot:XP_012898641.1 uncharacterized protein [Blastocystis hominis]
MTTIGKSLFRGKSSDAGAAGAAGGAGNSLEELGIDPASLPEKLRGLDERFIVNILSEIIDHGAPVTWDDIAGLAHAKQCVMEAVIWPMQRPDLFTGLRAVPRGLLLFGPPGTGKTLLGKAIAHGGGCTFFSISASSLTSKWMGEGEKMVRALFGVAEMKAPSVIFIDEIDSLLGMRREDDLEGTRRLKTEFLVQLDGVSSAEKASILVIGATNRPQDLDEAARRRFVKRLYIPLPDEETRKALFGILLKKNENQIDDAQIDVLVERSEGYSCADIHNLCREAAMGPIRDVSKRGGIAGMNLSNLRPINMEDFEYAFGQVRASVGQDDLDGYKQWNEKFGSLGSAGVA